MSNKPTPKKPTLAEKVSKACRQGEILKAARLIADANPKEVEFDALMARHAGLRDAFLRL